MLFCFTLRGSRLLRLRAACTTRLAHSVHAGTFADSLLAAASETFTKLVCVCACHDTPFFDRAVEQGVQARGNAVGTRRWGTVDLGPGEIPVVVVGSRWHIQACASWSCLERQGGGTSFFHAMEAAHKIGVVPSWHCTCSINRQRSFGPGPDVHECGAVCMRGENARAAALPC